MFNGVFNWVCAPIISSPSKLGLAELLGLVGRGDEENVNCPVVSTPNLGLSNCGCGGNSVGCCGVGFVGETGAEVGLRKYRV